MKKILLSIDEEYGYRHWIADLDKTEADALVVRWKSMRGLNCLVPVQLIIPQARLVDADGPIEDFNLLILRRRGALRCHVHDADDSYLELALGHEIPAAPRFEMDGLVYTEEMMEACRAAEQVYVASFYHE